MEANVPEAKPDLSRRLDRAEPGEDITATPAEGTRKLGWARGEFTVPDDFDDPLPQDVEDSFYQ
jgi:antitoxin (DNA-binding transcriptional repressor) of toxin-antitoxin stability system